MHFFIHIRLSVLGFMSLLLLSVLFAACDKDEPTNPGGWSCNSGECIEVTSGATYSSLEVCNAACSSGGGGVNCPSSVTFVYNNQTVTYGTVVSAGGRCWLDRNLGATQVATSPTDQAAYGDLYQWGRGADGHQIPTSPTTSTLSSSDQAGHGFFIKTQGGNWGDWRSPQNDNLWQGLSGVNNPCPCGFRLPTVAEWNEERLSWISNNASGAFASPLKLTVAGSRSLTLGSLQVVGIAGYYWSSTVSSVNSRTLSVTSSSASNLFGNRAFGFSVRCIKD